MAFNVTCSPGNDAAAAFMLVTAQIPALVIYLDPVNMAIQLPPFPGGDRLLAKFCRELAREAAKLAAAVDPDGETSPGESDVDGPRHRLRDGTAGRPRDGEVR